MDMPLQITFRGMSPMPSIGLLIEERSSRLARFADRIVRCKLSSTAPVERCAAECIAHESFPQELCLVVCMHASP